MCNAFGRTLEVCPPSPQRNSQWSPNSAHYTTRGVAWAPKAKRLEVLTEEIRGWYPDLAAYQTALAVGADYDIQVAEQSIEKSWVSLAEVSKAVGGLKGFLKVAGVTFKALAAVIGNSAAEGLQTEARTGKRRLVAVRK